MRNHIVVDFGDNVTSIFYWYYVDSLQKLKNSIEKRFKIQLEDQTFKHGDIVVDENSFGELYKNRFTEDIDLKVLSSDISLIRNERKRVSMNEEPSGRVDIPWLDLEDREFVTGGDSEKTISNLRQEFQKMIHKPRLDNVVFLLDDRIVLNEDQLIADLLLDREYLTLGVIEKYYELDREGMGLGRGLNILPRVYIIIPQIDVGTNTVEYPLLDVRHISLSTMKSWIESIHQIPCQEQELVCNGKVVSSENFPGKMYYHPPEPKIVKLHVCPTQDEKLNYFYLQNNIRTMPTVHLTSFDNEREWKYFYRGVKGKNVNEFIEDSLQIPQTKQYLFINNRRVSHNELAKLLREYGHNVLAPFKVNLIVQADDGAKGLLWTLELYGIRRMRSVVVKHPETAAILFDISLSKFNERQPLVDVISKRCPNLSADCVSLFHKQEKLDDAFFVKDMFALMFSDGSIEENFVVTLAVKPNIREDMKEFCEKNAIKYLGNININFLTGQFSIDLSLITARTIKDLKNQIYKVKRTPPHLQMIFYQNAELSDSNQLTSHSYNQESLTFNMVVKPGKEIELFINCVFLDGLHMDLKVCETDTIGDLKEMVSQRSGIPSSLMVAGSYLGEPDHVQIWETGFQYVFPVDFNKKVLLLIKRKGKEVQRKSHLIRYYDYDTIETLCEDVQRELEGEGHVTMEKNGFNRDTLLKDVGEKEITFLVNKNCSLM
eukprot:TCONS_00031387-protein